MFFGKMDILWEKFGLSNIFPSANSFLFSFLSVAVISNPVGVFAAGEMLPRRSRAWLWTCSILEKVASLQFHVLGEQ